MKLTEEQILSVVDECFGRAHYDMDNREWICFARAIEAAAAAPAISDTANCATCGAVGTVTSTKARCTLCGMFADTAKPTLKDHARRFVTDFSRDVGFVMSDAQQEIMLNLFLKHAASAQVIADTAGAK